MNNTNYCKLPRCGRCDTPLTFQNSNRNGWKKEGYSPHATICRGCVAARDREYKLDPEKRKTKFLTSARKRAETKGVPFSITKVDIHFPEFCPILGTKLNYDNKVTAADSPSLDRIVPHLGYVPGNVVIMSHRANTLKGNGTAVEHKLISDWLTKQN